MSTSWGRRRARGRRSRTPNREGQRGAALRCGPIRRLQFTASPASARSATLGTVAEARSIPATAQRPALVQVKGLSFRNLLESLVELQGADGAARALSLLPVDLRASLSTGAFIASGWYSIDEYKVLLHAVLEVMGRGVAFARELAMRSTRRDFRGIYRVLLFILTPESMIRKTPVIYGRYRRGGRVTARAHEEEGRGEVVFEDCHGFDVACWHETLGGIEAVLVAAGAKGVELTIVEGGTDDSAHARIDVRWAT
jgi:hypothetical protein